MPAVLFLLMRYRMLACDVTKYIFLEYFSFGFKVCKTILKWPLFTSFGWILNIMMEIYMPL